MSEIKKTVTVQLTTPVEHGGKTFNEFTFRQARTRDLVTMDKVQGQMAQTVALFALMADVTIDVMKEVTVADFNRIAVEAAPLVGELPAPAGQTSLQ